jgi:lipoprotein-anchoring transpeptidase ErfK/SrfK
MRLISLGVGIAIALLAPGADSARAQRHSKAMSGCGDALSFQVHLDRRSFSPGQIDGALGVNAKRALRAFQEANGLTASGRPDCDTWKALSGDGAPTTADYVITDEDVAGPFSTRIPDDLVAQAELPALAYTSVLERISERFHASPRLLQRLNRGASFAAGERITVPAVTPFDATASGPPNASRSSASVEVARDESALRVRRADGSLEFFAPVSSGSEHDPLPLGEWKVTGVQWHPPFHYNPDLFWDAEPSDTKSIIKPGPNNPVGVVWIDINVEHYGLHGTPEPSAVGHTYSHGCVRLTNWDAARLASIVGPGVMVTFR